MLISKKKIKTLTSFLFVFVFLVSFFVFSNISLGENSDFSITPDKPSTPIGNRITITAIKKDTINQITPEDSKVIFSANPAGVVVFSNKDCILKFETSRMKKACSVEATSSKPGTFTIKAFNVESNKTFNSSTSITFENGPEANGTGTDTNYVLLQKLPDGSGGELTSFESDPTKNPCPFGKYFNILIKLFFGIAGVLAVVMIVMAGIQYMTSDFISSKEEAKNSITNVIFGLLLALGAWLILNTINPDLLNVCLNNMKKAEITISPETNEETIGFNGKTTTVDGKTITACKTEEITTTGSDGKPLSLFGRPIPGGVNKIVVKDIEAINNAWKNSNLPAIKNYKINTVGGGYVCRSVRGQPNKTSAHSFGIAIDINPNTNPFEPGASTCKTDMPPEFVQLFKNQGWGWGGNWSSVKDAMHFSKLPTEVGHNSPCGGSSTTQPETYDSVSNISNIVYVKIKNFDNKKNPHTVLITRPSPNLFYEKHDNLNSTTSQGIAITLTQETYNTLKGTSINISVSNKEASLGNKTLLVK